MATGNSMRDEIREQQKKVFESQGLKGRIAYFFHYYKWYTLTGFLILLVGLSMLFDFITQKDIVMQAIYVNAFPNMAKEAFMDEFEKTIDINPKKEETILTDDFYIDMEAYTYYDAQNLEKLLVFCSTGSVDVCVVDESFLMHMAKGSYYMDLSTVLTKEQMDKYKDKIVWYDSPDDNTGGEAAIAIEITDAPKIASTQCYPNSKCYFSISITSPNVDNSLAYLEYLETP